MCICLVYLGIGRLLNVMDRIDRLDFRWLWLCCTSVHWSWYLACTRRSNFGRDRRNSTITWRRGTRHSLSDLNGNCKFFYIFVMLFSCWFFFLYFTAVWVLALRIGCIWLPPGQIWVWRRCFLLQVAVGNDWAKCTCMDLLVGILKVQHVLVKRGNSDMCIIMAEAE